MENKTDSTPVETKAVVIHRFGGPNVLKVERIPRPNPKRGQVLVEVDATSVNPVDHKIRTGKYKMFRPQLPAIIGRDVAGTIRAVDVGVKGPLKVGDAVFGMLDYPRGAYTRFTVATARELARRPKKVTTNEAGALGVAALTAWQDCSITGICNEENAYSFTVGRAASDILPFNLPNGAAPT